MPNDLFIERLLSIWEKSADKPTAQELCVDCPERLDEVRILIEQLKQADLFLRTRTLPVESTSQSSPIPEQIDNYRILEKLPEGGMGMVFRAEQLSPRREVALKVIRPDRIGQQALRRFEFEAEVLGRLEHPGIARVYEAGFSNWNGSRLPFFVMEYVHGKPLMDYVREAKPPLSLQGKLNLLLMICDAVQYAHQRGVIHRDLKPANILVDAAGNPRILDFGIAKLANSDAAAATMHTHEGQLIGTLQYMSPEQAGGKANDLDIRSDVYALGLIGYELLSGQRPYELQSRSLAEAIRVICEEEPSSLSALDRDFRGDLETIIGKALAKERERRYASVADLASDIRRYLGDEPITARRPSTWYLVRKFATRNKFLVSGAIATTLALAFGMAGTITGLIKAQRQRDRAISAEHRLTVMLADSFKDAAELARQRGNWWRTADLLGNAIELKTDDEPYFRVRRAQAFEKLDRKREAEMDLAAAAAHSKAATYRALILFQRANLRSEWAFDKAKADFQEALRLGLPPVETALANAQVQETFAGARPYFVRTLELDPVNIDAVQMLAITDIMLGHADRSLANVNGLMKIYPDDLNLACLEVILVAIVHGPAQGAARFTEISPRLTPAARDVIAITIDMIGLAQSETRQWVEGSSAGESFQTTFRLASLLGRLTILASRLQEENGVEFRQLSPKLKHMLSAFSFSDMVNALLPWLQKNKQADVKQIEAFARVVPLPVIHLIHAIEAAQSGRLDDAERELAELISGGPSVFDCRRIAAIYLVDVRATKASQASRPFVVLREISEYERQWGEAPPRLALLGALCVGDGGDPITILRFISIARRSKNLGDDYRKQLLRIELRLAMRQQDDAHALAVVNSLLHDNPSDVDGRIVRRELIQRVVQLDRGPTPATRPTSTTRPSRRWTPVARFSAGAEQDFTDKAGSRWSKASGFTGGTVAKQPFSPIGKSVTPEIYQWERWGPSTFSRQLPNGVYQIRLYFAERYAAVTEADQRVLRVLVQGNPLPYVDVFAEAGGRNVALVRSAETEVQDGWLRVQFAPSLLSPNAPLINAIEILREEVPMIQPSANPEGIPK